MSNYIAGAGPKTTCKIAIVGEAPGSTEDKRGVPFVGQAGKLLDGLLALASISRQEIYITNVIKHRPPNNNCTSLIDLSKKDPRLSPRYIEYEAELKEELETCGANIIIALGNVALFALTRKRSSQKYSGSILESTLLPGRKCTTSIHPAAALRNYLFRHYILFDLRRAKSQSLFSDIRHPEHTLITAPTFDECTSYLQGCFNKKKVAFDIEVSRLQLDCFSLCHTVGTAISIPLIKDSHSYFSLEHEAEILLLLSRLLEDKSVTKILQNAIFDSTFMYERYGVVTHNLEDTMIAQGLLMPDFPKGLDFITSRYTHYPYYKDDGKERWKGYSTNDQIFWEYSARDALVTFESHFPLQKDIAKMGLEDTYRSHVDLIHPLMAIQERGVLMDTEGIAVAKLESEKTIASLKQELETIVGYAINPNSPKQLQEYFYITKGLKPYLEKGRPTTNEDAMKRLSRRGFKEAEIIIKIRKQVKLKGTYYEVILVNGDTLSCSYNPIGTTTGRLASRKSIFGTGTNRQNQPKSMRKFMRVRAGFVSYNMDLSGAENRIVANIGPVPAMQRAFSENIDVHSLTASLLYGIPITEVSRESGSARIPNSTKSQRDMGKTFNHSGNYGVGYKTLALKSDLQESYVKPLLERYHQIYPEIRHAFHAQIECMINESRIVTNCAPFMRRRKFMGRKDQNLYNEAYAFPAQSTIADMINRWGVIFIYNHEELQDVYLFDQVHDSIGFEISLSLPWSYHAHAINLISDSLEQTLTWKSTSFNIPVDTEIFRGTLDNGRSVCRTVPLGAYPKAQDEYLGCQLSQLWRELA